MTPFYYSLFFPNIMAINDRRIAVGSLRVPPQNARSMHSSEISHFVLKTDVGFISIYKLTQKKGECLD